MGCASPCVCEIDRRLFRSRPDLLDGVGDSGGRCGEIGAAAPPFGGVCGRECEMERWWWGRPFGTGVEEGAIAGSPFGAEG